ncbi:MAG TPA: biotin--[acetyl-CoA-carboxylase] ligase [Geminicoccaceae bacterium]|nr:biotin--[acetyl-CoA-carboxylase] ligase [Geminicoccaceae bacterium]
MTNPCRLPDGFVLHAHDRLASTNDEALRLAEAGAPTGVVVWAGEQTRGRGRHGRTWTSPPGNLYASVLLRPDCQMAIAAQLSLVAGLALGEALAGLGPPDLDLQLKWPNDVLINGAKTAGILIEGASDPAGRAAWVIVGSGVNLISCPQDTAFPATFLAHEGFEDPMPQVVLEAYLAKLDHWLGRWQEAGFGAVRQAWLMRGFGLGGEIQLRLDRDELKGRFVDITDTGSLLLEQAGGRRREIAAGEVFYLGR